MPPLWFKASYEEKDKARANIGWADLGGALRATGGPLAFDLLSEMLRWWCNCLGLCMKSTVKLRRGNFLIRAGISSLPGFK